MDLRLLKKTFFKYDVLLWSDLVIIWQTDHSG